MLSPQSPHFHLGFNGFAYSWRHSFAGNYIQGLSKKTAGKPTGHGPMEKFILVIQLPGRLQVVTTCPKWFLDNTDLLNADHLLQGNPSSAWRFLRELNSMPNVQK